jgi:hypothetical protein
MKRTKSQGRVLSIYHLMKKMVSCQVNAMETEYKFSAIAAALNGGAANNSGPREVDAEAVWG